MARRMAARYAGTIDDMTAVPLATEWDRPPRGVGRADGGAAMVGAAIETENMERYSASVR